MEQNLLVTSTCNYLMRGELADQTSQDRPYLRAAIHTVGDHQGSKF